MYGADSDEEAYQLHTLFKKIFAEGGFNLHKFVTNSASLQCRIDAYDQKTGNNVHHDDTIIEEDSTYTGGILPGGCTLGGQKVLGVSWSPTSDTLEFDITDIAKSLHELKPTKRNIVGVASRV